jgi:hypothetical protein
MAEICRFVTTKDTGAWTFRTYATAKNSGYIRAFYFGIEHCQHPTNDLDTDHPTKLKCDALDKYPDIDELVPTLAECLALNPNDTTGFEACIEGSSWPQCNKRAN